MAIYQDLRYIHALGDGGRRPATSVVVIHATDNTASALSEANYARTRPDKTSAHFYVDDNQVIQALDTVSEAYGCLYHGNRISVQFELCGRSNQISDATMRRAAPVVARVCRDWGLPATKVSAAGVRNGARGICGHGDITAAFPEDGGDHTDPGGSFPWARFIGYVNEGEIDMTPEQDLLLKKTERMLYCLFFDKDANGPLQIPGDGADFPNMVKGRLAGLLTAVGQPEPVVLSDAQLDALATKVAALIAPLVSAPAAATADELARRLGNG